MKYSQGISVVLGLTEGSFDDVYRRGFHWLFSELVPSVRSLLRSTRRSSSEVPMRRSASLACYIVGDVHETNFAPRAAIRWYRRALSVCPDYASAWREIGTCQLEMGQYEQARASLLTALRLDPSDEWTTRELEDLKGLPPFPRYEANDACWAAAEALAENRAFEALEWLANAQGSNASQWRICAHAAAGDSAAVLHDLRRLRNEAVVCLAPEVWFFLPDDLWKQRDLWAALSLLNLSEDSAVPSDHHNLPAPTDPDASVDERIRAQITALSGMGTQPSDRKGR